MSDAVGIERTGHVAVVRLQRPPHNFFSEEMLTAVADAITAFDEQATVRAVVLCAQGKNFCAGADLRHMDEAQLRRIYRQALRIFGARKPIVAALHGSAVGGGLGLAMAADFRVVAPDARLTANFSRLGLHQGFGLSVTLPTAVGQSMAQELLYTGRDVSGEEAVGIGLGDRLSDNPREGAVAFAQEIAAAAPRSVTAIKASLRRSLIADVAAALDLEASAQGALLHTDDFTEGVTASIEKRPPEFTGH